MRDLAQLSRADSRGKRATLVLVAMVVLPLEGTFASSFRGLGTLQGGEPPYSFPRDVSADGTVVVGLSRSSKGFEAFRWTAASGMVGLGDLGGTSFLSDAFGVSADGQTIVGAARSPQSGSRTEAFRWTTETGMVGLGDLPGGNFSSAAVGVSSDGSVIAGSSSSDVSILLGEAFLWTQGTGLVGLGVLGGNQISASIPSRVSADGSVVVGWSFSGNGREAFRWTEPEGMIGLGDLPGSFFESIARGVSADGSVVVGLATDPGQTSFRWTSATGMVDLGRPAGANGSDAFGVSGSGSVVVGDAFLSGDLVPTIWDEANGMRNLVDVLVELGLGPAMEGWNLERATAISADGLTVVGWGYNPEGQEEAWLAFLGEPSVVEIPTTSSSALILFAAVLLVAAFTVIRQISREFIQP